MMMCTNSISNKNAKTIHKNKKPLTELIIKATEQNITEFTCSQLFFDFLFKNSQGNEFAGEYDRCYNESVL